VDQLLRDRKALLARIEGGHDLLEIARVMLVTIVVSSMSFGAAVGFYRGGEQIVYAALKFPLVLLFTAALCAPAFSALQKVVSGHTNVRADLALTLSSLALGSLFMAALAPVLLLAIMFEVDYHPLTLLTVACCSIGGVTGVSLFVRGVRGDTLPRRLVTGAALFLVVALVGTQMSWTLRPYLVRPRTEEVPFVRELEGSFLEAVGRSVLSSFEIYGRDYAPLPGEADPTGVYQSEQRRTNQPAAEPAMEPVFEGWRMR